jgi:hypothetical protein
MIYKKITDQENRIFYTKSKTGKEIFVRNIKEEIKITEEEYNNRGEQNVN